SSKTSWRRCRPWSSETACSQPIGNWVCGRLRRRLVRVAAYHGVSAQPAHGRHLAVRARRGSRPRQPREVRHRAAPCADHDQLRRHPPRLGRGHRVDRDAEPLARDGGVDEFGDFELTLEWNLQPNGNTGVFYRVTENDDVMWHTAPEYQIIDNAYNKEPLKPAQLTGANYDLDPPRRDATKPVGSWDRTRRVRRGPH